MLAEVLTWLVTPCPTAVRRQGYLKAAIGLASRAQRCQQAWATHQAQCRAAVMQSVAHCRQRRTALVLGSGLALEYPLEQLAAQFARVILADIVHLPAIRRRVRAFANVELMTYDLSGIIAVLQQFPRRGVAADLDTLIARMPRIDIGDLDWVVSCNVLSQLALLPVAWLRQRCPDLTDADLERWGRQLMTRHLAWLGEFEAERCLIADAEQFTYDRHGRLLERADFAAAFGLDRHAYATWDWDIAPPGELPAGLHARHRVVACRWPAADKTTAAPV